MNVVSLSGSAVSVWIFIGFLCNPQGCPCRGELVPIDDALYFGPAPLSLTLPMSHPPSLLSELQLPISYQLTSDLSLTGKLSF